MCGGNPLFTVLSIMGFFLIFNQNIGYYFIYIAIELFFDILHQNEIHVLCISTYRDFVLYAQNITDFLGFPIAFDQQPI